MSEISHSTLSLLNDIATSTPNILWAVIIVIALYIPRSNAGDHITSIAGDVITSPAMLPRVHHILHPEFYNQTQTERSSEKFKESMTKAYQTLYSLQHVCKIEDANDQRREEKEQRKHEVFTRKFTFLVSMFNDFTTEFLDTERTSDQEERSMQRPTAIPLFISTTITYQTTLLFTGAILTAIILLAHSCPPLLQMQDMGVPEESSIEAIHIKAPHQWDVWEQMTIREFNRNKE